MTSATPFRRRRLAWCLAGGTLLIIAAATATAWEWEAARLRSGVLAWVVQQRQAGRDISYAAPVASGFPLRVVLTYADWHIRATSPAWQLPLSWGAGTLRVQAALLHPGQVVAEARGEQSLQLGSLPPLHLSAQALRALPAPGGGFDLAGRGIEGTTIPVKVATLSAHVGDPDGALQLTADGVAVPPGTAPALGDLIDSVALTLRAAGGTSTGSDRLEVKALRVQWGAATAEAKLSVALDEAGQPTGHGSVTVSGWARVAEALGEGGALDPRTAQVIRAFLALLAGSAADAQTRPIELPFVLQHSILSIGGIPILRLPELTWRSG